MSMNGAKPNPKSILKTLFAFPVTLAAIVLAVVLVSAASFGSVDLIQLNLKFLEGVEQNELDDLFVGFLLIGAALIIDLFSRAHRHRIEIERQRLASLQATMRTVQDIFNNFLNNLLLFRLESENALSNESLVLFDSLIQETAAKLRALGDLKSTEEVPMATGSAIGYKPVLTSRAPAPLT
jgi:hypothetical protein